MPHEVRKDGGKYVVIETDTETLVFGPTTKAKAEDARQALSEAETSKPDKVGYLSDGTKVNVTFKNKEKYNG